MRAVLIFAAVLAALAGCEKSQKDSIDEVQKSLSAVLGNSLEELKNLGPDEAMNELKKLRHFEYRVLSVPSSPAKLEARLNAEGLLGWDCFDVQQTSGEDGKPAYLVFCKRRPDTPLKYVPQTIIGR